MQICDDGTTNLLAGIVKRAVLDWKHARRCLRKNPYSKNAVIHEGEIIDIERFFRSPHFARMTGISGDAFIHMLREQEG